MKYSSGREKLSVSCGEKGTACAEGSAWSLLSQPGQILPSPLFPSLWALSTYSPCRIPGGGGGPRAPGLRQGDVLTALPL